MSETIFTVIAFAAALFSFLIYNYIEGTAQDAMIDVTAQVVKDSPMDNSYKNMMNSTLALINFVGVIAFFGGIFVLVKKYF